MGYAGAMKSRVIESGIARVEHRGRSFFRVQLSGLKVGGRRLSKAASTYDEAQAIKRAWLLSGGAPLPEEAIPTAEATLEDALRAYVADLAARRKDAQRAKQVIAALRALPGQLLGLPLSRVTVASLYGFRQAREDAGLKPNTIIRDLRVLRATLRKARPDLRVPADVFPRENLTRVRVLQPAEEARVFPRLAEPFRTMARLAALTLMRLSDVRTLEVDMLQLEQGVIFLPKTKTDPRPVILGDEAIALLTAQLARRSAESPYVFASPRTGRPYTRWTVSAQWRRAARAAGLTHFTFHDLKHHGATIAATNGANDAALMALGGWRRPEQIRRYAAVVSGRMRELANGIAQGLRHEHRPPEPHRGRPKRSATSRLLMGPTGGSSACITRASVSATRT